MTFATLRALHAIIGTAIDDIEKIYLDASGSELLTPSPPAAQPSTPRSAYSPYPSPTSPSTPFTPQRSHRRADSIPYAESYDYAAPLASPFSPRGRTRSDSRAPRPQQYAQPTQPLPAPPSTPSWRQKEPKTPPTPPTPPMSASSTCISTPPRSPTHAVPTPVPVLDYPDLDVPYYPPPPSSTDDDGLGEERSGTQSEAEDARTRAEALTSHPEVIAATNRLVAACGQLTASMQRPFLTLCDAAMGYHLPACLRVLEASHAVEILRVAGPRGLHVRELARRISEMRGSQRHSGDDVAEMDPSQLSHILRLLATHHITREVRPDVFANNRLSAAMDSGHGCAEIWDAPQKKYDGTNGIAAFVGVCTDELFKNSAYLADCYLPSPLTPSVVPPPLPERTLKTASPPSLSTAKSLNDLNSRFTAGIKSRKRTALYAPFNLAFRTSAPYFEWLERPGNAARLHRFGRAMTGTGGWEVPGAIISGFPWHDVPEGGLVVDVGGGIGSASIQLARTFSHLRFLVQDRPQVVSMGEAAWRTRCPEFLDTGRAAFQAHDFFAPQPPLPLALAVHAAGQLDGGGRRRVHSAPAVFLLRVIIHDWPDAYVTKILLHLRRAAAPHTRLLLVEHILPLACVDEDEGMEVESDYGSADTHEIREPLPGRVRTLAPEGSPLLPNLGKANANAYWMDMTMHATFNARERTLREFAALALTAGWRIEQVARAEGSLFGYITAVPVDIPPSALAMLQSTAPAVPPMPSSASKENPSPGRGAPWRGDRARNASDSRINLRHLADAGRGESVPALPKMPSGLFRGERRRADSLLPSGSAGAQAAVQNVAGAESRTGGVKALKRMLSRVQLGRSDKKEK